MEKEKTKVEEIKEVQAELAKAAFVILVQENGDIHVQDGKQIFGEQVEVEGTPAMLYQVIKILHEKMERAKIVAAVKAELAKSFVGGTN